VTAWALGAFLELANMPYVSLVVWGTGAGATAASALGLLGGHFGRFFASHTAFFGLLGGLLAAVYQVSAVLDRPWLFVAVAAVSTASALLLGGGVRRGAPARPYDDPDVTDAKRVEAEFVKTGDVALLATYVAYHLARGGVEERRVVEAVRLAVSYRDIEPSPFAPPLVVRLVEKLNRRRRMRHLQRVKAALRAYL
jgi:hypothetical protein